MTHIFYLLLFIFIYYEIWVRGNAKRLSEKIKEYKSVPAEGQTEYISKDSHLLTWALFNIFYFFYVFIGMFTSQWWLFLTIIAMSFIPKKTPLARKINAIATISILLFILINKYHLHINIF